MTLTLKLQEWEEEIWDTTAQDITSSSDVQLFEYLSQLSQKFGQGGVKNIEVHPEICLSIFDYELCEDVVVKFPESEHPLQFSVCLSGTSIDEYGGKLGAGYTCISGGGMQRQMLVKSSKSRHTGIDIHMSANLLQIFFPNRDGEILPQLRLLAKGDDWQTLIYPEITNAIEQIVKQMICCPYQGITKQMYLQGKVIELMALQLAPILNNQGELPPSPQLKPTTVNRVHHAREILHFRLENPPSLAELAQMVGISDRTLRYGFKALFGTTVFNYLTQKRLERAEQLLRNGGLTVAEVANLLGYSHLGHFAAAFKRQFGITPSECLLGKKSISAL
ncbi:DNA-binding domain-containing protein, AraC-type [Nostoc sp. PCC 7524]|uniref:helix-turn-helix transcriptional regulator n=1 Tax=Nostoc sp. (strain ATCC 29411 / PCC 7524) TaxID=28072 RepID=UPI00029ED7FA|nr:AraC family transcriptional regulator [Nostoc sp. PCC 7524]AFY49071.1 DNA-binding domain-containing protein, AraC-type [Nostoc sp. PCC 7524]